MPATRGGQCSERVKQPYRRIIEDEEGHGSMPQAILKRYATTGEKQDAARHAVAVRPVLFREYLDSLDRWAMGKDRWLSDQTRRYPARLAGPLVSPLFSLPRQADFLAWAFARFSEIVWCSLSWSSHASRSTTLPPSKCRSIISGTSFTVTPEYQVPSG
jgi:hypothetical protein